MNGATGQITNFGLMEHGEERSALMCFNEKYYSALMRSSIYAVVTRKMIFH